MKFDPDKFYRDLETKLTVERPIDDTMLLSEKEAAAVSGLSLNRFRRYRIAGYGPEHIRIDNENRAFHVNGSVLYSVLSVSIWNQLRRDGAIPRLRKLVTLRMRKD